LIDAKERLVEELRGSPISSTVIRPSGFFRVRRPSGGWPTWGDGVHREQWDGQDHAREPEQRGKVVSRTPTETTICGSHELAGGDRGVDAASRLRWRDPRRRPETCATTRRPGWRSGTPAERRPNVSTSFSGSGSRSSRKS